MYDILIIDPPWKQTKGGKRNVRPKQGKSLDYEVMTTNDIFTLLDKNVFPLGNETHTIFMWTIEKFLPSCEVYMKRRGYKRHVRMIWNKLNGIAPAFSIRYTHEYLIWYYKPKFTNVSKEVSGVYTSVFNEKSRSHSRKPDIAYDMIKAMFPTQSIIDVFSREKRDGIDQRGNELNFFEQMNK